MSLILKQISNASVERFHPTNMGASHTVRELFLVTTRPDIDPSTESEIRTQYILDYTKLALIVFTGNGRLRCNFRQYLLLEKSHRFLPESFWFPLVPHRHQRSESTNILFEC